MEPSRSFSYTPHAVITIEGNADFASAASAEGWQGNGNRNDPYIISGYDIDGLGYRNAVFIGNTTVYFVVRDCYLHNSKDAGIALWNVGYGLISNNTCSGNDPWGIYLNRCFDSAVVDNFCSNNSIASLDSSAAGIALASCDSVNVSSNDCSSNGYTYYGIGISGSGSNCVVYNNTCRNNGDCGIAFSGDGNDILRNFCTVNGDGLRISGSSTASFNSCLLNSGSGIEARGPAVVAENECIGGMYGIAVGGIGCAVSLNNCTQNHIAGIFVSDGSYSTILGNNCSAGDYDGIKINSYSDHTTVDRNTCSWNGRDGIVVGTPTPSPVVYSDGNKISNNSCSSNVMSGVAIYYGSNTLVSDNLCSDSGWAGIRLKSIYCALKRNSMYGDGVVLNGGAQEWGLNSIDTTNLVNGKPVYYLVDDVGSSVPAGYGQYILANCRHSSVVGMSVDNTSVGISLGLCENVSVSDSRAENSTAGIELDQCENITVTNCSALWNSEAGIRVMSSDYNSLSNNTCTFNMYGMLLLGADWNDITNNTCSWNTATGLRVDKESSRHNRIAYNVFEDNPLYGVSIESMVYSSDPLAAARMPLPGPMGGYNLIYGNSFINNDARDDDWGDGLNSWNMTGYGNWWSDWQSPDANGDGIVDSPRAISGDAGAQDYYPLTVLPPEPIPELPALGYLAVTTVLCILVLCIRRSRLR